MKCQVARSKFSLLFDDRLESRLGSYVQEHLRGCSACEREWLRFSRVFRGTLAICDEVPVRPFPVQGDAPGEWRDRPDARPRVLWTPGARIAAAVLIILSLSHVAVFQMARSDESGPAPGPDLAARSFEGAEPARSDGDVRVASGATPGGVSRGVLENASLRNRIGDHLDAASLFLRILHHMPAGADHEAARIIEPHLRLLDVSKLRSDLRRSPDLLAGGVTAVHEYLGAWDDLGSRLDAALGAQHRERPLLDDVNGVVRSSFVPVLLRNLQARFGADATGQSWKSHDSGGLLSRFRGDETPPDVVQFLDAHDEFLQTRYADAGLAFERLAESPVRTRLGGISRYMSAEAYMRARHMDRVLFQLDLLRLNPPENPALFNLDSVAMLAEVSRLARSQGARAVFSGGAGEGASGHLFWFGPGSSGGIRTSIPFGQSIRIVQQWGPILPGGAR